MPDHVMGSRGGDGTGVSGRARFTVVMATADRPDQIAGTLEAVGGAIAAAGGDHALVVADNGSRASAREAVEAFASRAPFQVAYLRCAPANRSAAMNAGLRAAETEWIAFTDDDTEPDRDWLSNASAYAAASGCRVFGGRVTPLGATAPLPAWYRPDRSGRKPGFVIEVAYDPMERSGLLEPSHKVPYGANMFVRRDMFDQYGGFDEALWEICGKAALGGDDTEFLIRLRSRGEAIGYCHEALVRHPVHCERANLRAQLSLAYEYGWRSLLVFGESNPVRRELYRFKRMAGAGGRALAEWMRGNQPDAVSGLLLVAYHCGALVCRLSPVCRRWKETRAAREETTRRG